MNSESSTSVPSDPGTDGPGANDAVFLGALAELRSIAGALLTKERRGHTLQATALVNEAFLRLRACDPDVAADPERFLRVSATAMRRILIDHARSRTRQKRGGGALPTSLDSVQLAARGDLDQVLLVDDAIETMALDAPELAELVRLRFYAGLDVAGAARALGKSERTAEREWTYAKARLFRLLGGLGPGS